MKAQRLHAAADIHSAPLRLCDVPDPEPGAGEIRLSVRCCAICRTDLHVIEGDLPAARRPVIPGHQIVGVVEKLGEGCSRFHVGARVGVAWLRFTCGACRFCAAGKENLCEVSRFTGYHADGGYAEKAVVDEQFAYEIPSAFSDVQAAPLLCAGIIGFRSLQRSELPAGGKLGLYGFGSSAHIVMQLARHRGCEVYVVTRGADHRRLAEEMGAVWTGASAAGLPVKVDSAILFAPVGDLVPSALEKLEKGGTLALAGIHMTDVPPLAYQRHLFFERSIRSVTANTREDGRRLLQEAAAIPITPRTTLYPLREANRALQDLKDDRINGTGVLVIDH